MLPQLNLIRNAFTWQSGFQIDADGCPRAYHPDSKKGLDYLANAGKPGHWYGLVCNEFGNPIVQGPQDPAPGFYVSPTALVDRSKPFNDPRRYVDSEAIPYIAVPPELRSRGAQLGDVCWVLYKGRQSGAVIADIGPHGKIGEGSIALAKALGIPYSPRNGGVSSGVEWVVFRGSSRGWPRTVDDLLAQAGQLYQTWVRSSPASAKAAEGG